MRLPRPGLGRPRRVRARAPAQGPERARERPRLARAEQVLWEPEAAFQAQAPYSAPGPRAQDKSVQEELPERGRLAEQALHMSARAPDRPAAPGTR